MAHGLLQKPLAGVHFLLFKPTLQRGGTCEAHGIEAKLAHIADKSKLEPPVLNCLKLNIFKNGVLEGSRLDFGGPGARFWRVRG